MGPSRPVRVLHVVPSYWPAKAYGGPTESVHALCLAEARAGAVVAVRTSDADGERRLDPAARGAVRWPTGLRVRYHRRWAGESIAPGLVAGLPRAMAGCDVVHLTAVYSFPTIPTLVFARLVGKPVVWSPRGSLLVWQGMSRPGLKAAWRRVCAAALPRRAILHATSEPEAEASRRAFPGIDAVVIPNGVDVPEPSPRARSRAGLHLVFLGRLHPIKAVENLIDACARCVFEGWSEWSLSIAGDGDAAYESSLRRRVEGQGLSDRVGFVGFVDGARKTELLRSADLVVVPSHSENFSMVVVEALAHGVPVVASRGTPWPELEARGCGWWVENTPERLSATLDAARKADLAEMGERGRRWMLEAFRWDSIAARMLDVYSDLAFTGGRA